MTRTDNRAQVVSAKQVANLFVGLVSESPIWFDSSAGIVSVNTQARRLGSLSFLLGKILQGQGIESLLFEVPSFELIRLKENLSQNGYFTGHLTSKASSIRHYIDAACRLHLITKQGAVYNLTHQGQLLLKIGSIKYSSPYPLSDAIKICFLNLILRYDYFGLVAVIVSLLNGTRKLTQIQREYQPNLLELLEKTVRSGIESRYQRMVMDRTLTIRNWKKPETYAEHLVSAKIGWLLDLGIVRLLSKSPLELSIDSVHERWLSNLYNAGTLSEALIVACSLNYALMIHIEENAHKGLSKCKLLDTALLKLSRDRVLLKVRSSDLVLSLICLHPHELLQRINIGEQFFPKLDVECGGKRYRLHTASRSTQSFIVINNKENY